MEPCDDEVANVSTPKEKTSSCNPPVEKASFVNNDHLCIGCACMSPDLVET